MNICFFLKFFLITALLNIVYFPSLQANEEGTFLDWVKNISLIAKKEGISENTIELSFQNISQNKRVIELDQDQPEFTLSLEKYLNNATPLSRVNKGKKLYSQNKKILKEIADKYGVQSRFILALWGIETSYGNYTGSFNVVRSLMTLSHNLRRRDFFTEELINALTIIDQGHIEPSQMMGSWAGAMGQNQFMPSSFLSYATDFDMDGKKDIWSTLPDVFASSSNYLSSSGWNNEETWGREVIVVNKIDENFITTSAKEVNINKSLKEWSSLGVVSLNGNSLPDKDLHAYLVYPEGENGRKYIVYENFKTLMKWNRSLFFGIAVGTLSDMIEYH